MRIRLMRFMDYMFLFTYIAFELDFGIIKYVFALLFVAVFLTMEYIQGYPLSINDAGKSFFTIVLGIAALCVITFVLQIINGFQSYALNETIYFITPLFFVWTYANVTSQERIYKILTYLFYILVGVFLYRSIPNLTLENIKRINFLDSYSVFESGLAYPFVLLECFFLYKKEKRKAIVSMILGLLSFKRFAMIAAIVIFIISKWTLVSKPVKNRAQVVAIVFFVTLPVLTCIMCTDAVDVWFADTFGISLRKLTMTRFDRIAMVLESEDIKYGLGSTTVFMTEALNEMHQSNIDQRNLHNDLVRIYVECGLLGTVVFTTSFIKAVAKQRWIFVAMLYILAECFFNHLLGAGTVSFWILAYLLLAYSQKEQITKQDMRVCYES